MEIIKLNYFYMGPYLNNFMQITQAFMLNADETKVAGYSIEIWNSLCEEEYENKENPSASLIRNYNWIEIANLLFSGLAHTQMNTVDLGIDDEENQISSACTTCLHSLSEIIREPLFELQFKHVEELMGQEASPEA